MGICMVQVDVCPRLSLFPCVSPTDGSVLLFLTLVCLAQLSESNAFHQLYFKIISELRSHHDKL